MDDQWLIEVKESPEIEGTMIVMIIANDSVATAQETFDKFATPEDDYGFTRTHIPI